MRAVKGQPDWALGFEDETGWSRLAQPNMNAWTEVDHPLRLVEKALDKDEPGPKALAGYGLVVRGDTSEKELADKVWLRFVDGNPNSALTIQFLVGCCEKLQCTGKQVLVLIWDHASWHISQTVCDGLRDHNRQVKKSGQGVRILNCLLPKNSPWLNPIEPMWIHSKRKVVEPDPVLLAKEIAERVCAAFDNPYESHLTTT